MKNNKQIIKTRFYNAVYIFAFMAAAFLMFESCASPTNKNSNPAGPVETEEDESTELDNPDSALYDDKNSKLKDIIPIKLYPPIYSMTGNAGAVTLFIQPKMKSKTASAVVTVDNNWWGTWNEEAGWEWPTEEAVDQPEEPVAEDPPAADENAPRNTIPFNTNLTVIITTNGKTNPIGKVYTYNVTRPDAPEPPAGTVQGVISGRITGNFSVIFPGSNYAKSIDDSVNRAGKDGWTAKVVQALDAGGNVIGSTEFADGSFSGRYWTLPVIGTSEIDKTTLKFRVVFQKPGAAPHYSYPAVPLTRFAGTEEETAADKPYEHTIFPLEAMYTNANDTVNSGNYAGKWLVNGVDYEVPQNGKITQVILEAAAAGEVHIGLWRNVLSGQVAVLVTESTVNASVGRNTYTVDWTAQAGDKIGVMSAGTGFVRVNEIANGMAFVCKDKELSESAIDKVKFGAVGVGYVLKPDASKQFEELPVELAVIPVGGRYSSNANAEYILRNIGEISAYPLIGSYMLFEDVALSQGNWYPIGRNNKNSSFIGRFYGNGHTISNIVFENKNPVSYDMIGFFGWVGAIANNDPVKAGVYGGPIIRDLNLVINTAAPFTFNTALNTEVWVGGLAGTIQSAPVEITNVHIRGDVPGRPWHIKIPITNRDYSFYCGGLIGRIYFTTTETFPHQVTGCSNSLDIYAAYERGQGFIGGILGCIRDTTCAVINGCYNDGAITAHQINRNVYDYIGGIVGKNNSTGANIFNSYSTGKTTLIKGASVAAGTADAGEVIVSGPGAAEEVKVYYDKQLAGTNPYRVAGIAGEPYEKYHRINYTYSAASVALRGNTNGGYLGGIAADNYNHNEIPDRYSFNAALNPSLSYDTDAGIALYRITRNAKATAQNYAWKGMRFINNTTGATSGTFPYADSVQHGTGKDLAEFAGSAKTSTYTALNWKFESNATANPEDGVKKAGRDWYWKFADGSNYPFPLLWWQYKSPGQSGTHTGVDGTQQNYQWWETQPPAIDETWDTTQNTSSIGHLIIPHEF
ncbi:MAG: hypothetical protein LBG72_03345 [Spirochaetaceae bacterium]|nr:hypothetical protein [Spirochaetaceae bacterium]